MKLFKNFSIKNKIIDSNVKPFTTIGKGFTIDDYKQKKLLDIKQLDENRLNHTFIFGAPGVGKTKLLEGIIEQDIPKGENVIVIDPKGDISLFSKMYQTAKLHGREKEILFLSPIYPEYSISINPLKNHYLEEEIISHIVSGITTKDEFFYNVAYETTTAIVKALLMIRRETKNSEPINFNEVANYAHYDGLKTLHTNISSIKNEKENKEQLIILIEQILASPQDYFAKVSSTLRTTLTQMTIGNVGKIMGNVNENIFIDKLEQGKGVILYIQTGSILTRQTSSIISKVVISMIQSIVGRYYASGESFKRRLNLYIDEMASSVYMGIENLYTQGRAANVSITGLTQSISDIVAEIGRDRANKLFDLTSTKIVMRLNENSSALVISELGGTRKRYSPFLSSNGGITSREVEELNIKPEDITRLQKREFYYFGFEGEFKGKTAPVKQSNIMIQMPKII